VGIKDSFTNYETNKTHQPCPWRNQTTLLKHRKYPRSGVNLYSKVLDRARPGGTNL
jgi:hypothetical protein